MALEDLLAFLGREQRGEHRRNVVGRDVHAWTGLGSDVVFGALRRVERTASLVVEYGGVVLAILLLHGRCTSAASRERIEQALGGASRNDCVGDGVGVALVDVAGSTDATGELNTATSLHGVRCLVRRGVEVRCAAKRNGASRRVGRRSEALRGVGSRSTDVSAHAADVVLAEQPLDRTSVGQWLAGSCDTGGCDLLCILRSRTRSVGFPLHRSGDWLQGHRQGRFPCCRLLDSCRADIRAVTRIAHEIASGTLSTSAHCNRMKPGTPTVKRGAGCADEHSRDAEPRIERRVGSSRAALQLPYHQRRLDLGDRCR